MKTPFMNFDTRAIIREFGEVNRKLIRGTETLTEVDEIDVGTAPKELVYEEDKLRLYHYKQDGKVTCRVPVLIIYALVNRQYMLDLQPDRSIVRNLLQHGIDLYIVDWGYPTKADMYLTLDDYINGYLNSCVDFVKETTKSRKINLMGICQGGTFSAIYASLYPEKIKNLVTLVTPIDFSTNDALLFSWSKNMNADALVDAYRIIPGDFLNAGFLMLMPFTLNIRKYLDMLDTLEDKEKLLNFLRMEKWIFDSPGQAGECLRQFIKDCYQENKLVKGGLKVGDKTVNLKNITMPLLNIYASGDHLVPPSSTKPLNDLVGTNDKVLYEFKGGHIGVFVGSKSQKELAPTIAQWLQERADGEKAKDSPSRPEEPQAKAIKSAKPEQSEKSLTREQSGAKREKTNGGKDKRG
ncbi:MAG TPA: class III poly(R)-hydroxyalkanoic acid synthase subunit PhaC [Nitrospiraceae bacterium]|jgi:polyhydroxyalkanoate synthase|nr:class III poly(R)-hydroxyalkanoic acid synthase subunit PhaC [Nitrospiraceae bacterium]